MLIQFSCSVLVSEMTENVENINANSLAHLRGEEDCRNIKAGGVIDVSHDPIIDGSSMAGNKRRYKDNSKRISQIKSLKGLKHSRSI